MPHKHTNAFIDLSGMPYVLAEYLDKDTFQQLDRSLIKSEIIIDDTEAMRAVIDISVDDIGRRASDHSLNVLSNRTLQKSIIDMIKTHYYQLDHHLPVLRRGIVLRVNYQIENKRTGQVMRTMVEDLRINNRNYFVDINSKDIDDNAIVVNFCDSMVSTINQFTHGYDPMVFRITSINMFYECVRPNLMRPRVSNSIYSRPDDVLPHGYNNERDMYDYHKSMQNEHFIGDPYEHGRRETIPHQWYDFNRFYHFEDNGHELILHQQEIDDIHDKIVPLACGTIQVNRAFLINPGHRIIFKFSIWKNDLAVFNDTKDVAEALHVQGYEPHHHDHHHHDEDYDKIMEVIRSMQHMDYRQNDALDKINGSINDLYRIISYQPYPPYPPMPPIPPRPPVPPVPPDPKPDPEPKPDPKPHHKDKKIELIMKLIKHLQDEIDDIREHGTDCDCNPIPISEEEIQNILDSLDDSSNSEVSEALMSLLDKLDEEVSAEANADS